MGVLTRRRHSQLHHVYSAPLKDDVQRMGMGMEWK